MTIPKLLHDEKVLIFKFLCVLAWADFIIHPNERKLIEQLALDFQVGPNINQMIQGWLQHPPRPEEVDPYTIPTELIELILEHACGVAKADGGIDIWELEMIELLHSLCA